MSVQKKFGQVERTPFDDAAIETLIASGLFAGVARSEIGGFLAQFGARCRSFQNGEVVADEGAMLSEMGVVLSGHLHVYDSAFTGERHLIRIVRPGGVVGASLISSGLPASSFADRLYIFNTQILPAKESPACFINFLL